MAAPWDENEMDLDEGFYDGGHESKRFGELPLCAQTIMRACPDV